MNLTTLQKAVLHQLGHNGLTEEAKQELTDVTNHGAENGVSGFIYHKDTCEFYDKNVDVIDELLSETADSIGVTPLELVASFVGDKNVNNETTRKNLMAWFALEEVARQLTDN